MEMNELHYGFYQLLTDEDALTLKSASEWFSATIDWLYWESRGFYTGASNRVRNGLRDREALGAFDESNPSRIWAEFELYDYIKTYGIPEHAVVEFAEYLAEQIDLLSA